MGGGVLSCCSGKDDYRYHRQGNGGRVLSILSSQRRATLLSCVDDYNNHSCSLADSTCVAAFWFGVVLLNMAIVQQTYFAAIAAWPSLHKASICRGLAL